MLMFYPLHPSPNDKIALSVSKSLYCYFISVHIAYHDCEIDIIYQIGMCILQQVLSFVFYLSHKIILHVYKNTSHREVNRTQTGYESEKKMLSLMV